MAGSLVLHGPGDHLTCVAPLGDDSSVEDVAGCAAVAEAGYAVAA